MTTADLLHFARGEDGGTKEIRGNWRSQNNTASPLLTPIRLLEVKVVELRTFCPSLSYYSLKPLRVQCTLFIAEKMHSIQNIGFSRHNLV
jgi:hypothetical protein